MQISEYIIPGIVPADDILLQKGTYIVVTHATTKPPHLSLLIEGEIFSLGVKGPKLAMPLATQLRIIKSKKIESLFFKLDISVFIHNNQLFKVAKTHTLAYSRVEMGIATCLSPIKNFCSAIFEVDIRKVNYIFDLLPVLYQHNHIQACLHYNMQQHLTNTNFHLEKYTMEDIYNSIVMAEEVG